MTLVIYTKYIWSGLIVVAIFFRHSPGARDCYHSPACPVPGEFWWCSLCSDWSDSDQPWPLIGHKAHIGRVLTDLDSHLSQARMTDPGPESWADPDRIGKGFCSMHELPQNFYTPFTAEIILARYPILSRGVTKNMIFSRVCVRPKMLHKSFLSTASLVMEWWDLIKINSLHAYLCLFYLSTRRLVHM